MKSGPVWDPERPANIPWNCERSEDQLDRENNFALVLAVSGFSFGSAATIRGDSGDGSA